MFASCSFPSAFGPLIRCVVFGNLARNMPEPKRTRWIFGLGKSRLAVCMNFVIGTMIALLTHHPGVIHTSVCYGFDCAVFGRLAMCGCNGLLLVFIVFSDRNCKPLKCVDKCVITRTPLIACIVSAFSYVGFQSEPSSAMLSNDLIIGYCSSCVEWASGRQIAATTFCSHFYWNADCIVSTWHTIALLLRHALLVAFNT